MFACSGWSNCQNSAPLEGISAVLRWPWGCGVRGGPRWTVIVGEEMAPPTPAPFTPAPWSHPLQRSAEAQVGRQTHRPLSLPLRVQRGVSLGLTWDLGEAGPGCVGAWVGKLSFLLSLSLSFLLYKPGCGRYVFDRTKAGYLMLVIPRAPMFEISEGSG